MENLWVLSIFVILLCYLIYNFIQYGVSIYHYNRHLKSIPGPGVFESIKVIIKMICSRFKDGKEAAQANNIWIHNLCDKYGKECGMVKFWSLIFPPWLFVCNAKNAQLFLNHENSMNKASFYKMIKFTVSGDGLLTCDYDKVDSIKKELVPFFKLTVLNSYLKTIEDNLVVFNENVEKCIDNEDGHCNSFKTMLSTFIVDNIGDNLFNIKFNSQANGREPPFVQRADKMLEHFDIFLFRQWKFFFTNRVFFYSTVLFDDLFIQNIRLIGNLFHVYLGILGIIFRKYRELYLNLHVNSTQVKLFDSVMLSRMSKGLRSLIFNINELFSHGVTIALVGHDTTTTTASWMTYFLAHFPEVQDKLCSEIDSFVNSGENITVLSLRKLKYAEYVINETLRLAPVSPYLGRSVSQPIVFDEKITIPAGTNVSIAINYMNHCEEYFKNPEQFYPERFEPSARNSENAVWCNNAAFMPFSVGQRTCIGKNYAILQLKTFLVLFFSKYRIVALDRFGDLSPSHNLVQRPVDFPVKLTRR